MSCVKTNHYINIPFLIHLVTVNGYSLKHHFGLLYDIFISIIIHTGQGFTTGISYWLRTYFDWLIGQKIVISLVNRQCSGEII